MNWLGASAEHLREFKQVYSFHTWEDEWFGYNFICVINIINVVYLIVKIQILCFKFEIQLCDF